jgi:hypothetical protein
MTVTCHSNLQFISGSKQTSNSEHGIHFVKSGTIVRRKKKKKKKEQNKTKYPRQIDAAWNFNLRLILAKFLSAG